MSDRCHLMLDRPARAAGFTLVEMMIAVLLLALLATAAALSFSQPLQAARGHDAIEECRAFDVAARQAATASGQGVRLVFDLSSGTISRREGPDSQQRVAKVALPRGFRIDEMRIQSDSTSSGETIVDVSSLGLSRTYAVHLLGPGLDQWLLFAGMTGQMTQVRNEESLDSILQTAAGKSPWHDAD